MSQLSIEGRAPSDEPRLSGLQSKLQVMHLITGTGVGGAEMMLFKLLSQMNRNIFSNVVISMLPPGPTAERITGIGVSVETLGMSMGVPDPLSVLRLARAIRRWRPHILQTWMYHADLLGGVVGKLLFRVPVIWNIRHGNLDPGQNSWLTLGVARLCARLSASVPDRIVCCADSSRLLHSEIGYNDAKMTVIPNGFDLETYRPQPDARLACFQQFGISASAEVISLIARYHSMKDHPSFVAAANVCRRSFPDVLFVLCGDDITPANEPLMAIIRAAGVEKNTLLLGRRTPAEISLIMSRSSIVTSSSFAEAFPNVIGEAMACGAVCVATDVGDSARIVGDAGVLVPARSPDELGAAWASILGMDEEARLNLGRAARRRIEADFGISAIVSQYEKLYLSHGAATVRNK